MPANPDDSSDRGGGWVSREPVLLHPATAVANARTVTAVLHDFPKWMLMAPHLEKTENGTKRR
jgi:hypothetical protein